MSPLAPLRILARKQLRHVTRLANDCRSSSHSKTLDEPNVVEAESGDAFAGRSSEKALCQCDTSQRAPLWHSPTIRPTFAAQVLGQLLMAERGGGAILCGYRDVMMQSSDHRCDIRI